MARKIKKKGRKNQSNKKKPGKTFGRAAVIGFFGGLIWSLTGWVCALFKFTSVFPSVVLSPFPRGPWNHPAGGNFLAIAVISLISVAIALFYQLVLSRIKSIWAGVLFGFLLWCGVFFPLASWLPGLETPGQMGFRSSVTTICLFVLYGLFVGYSIAFEMGEETQSSDTCPNG